MVNRKTRDNSRTPMQWNASKNAGFTDGQPWIRINNNYKNINVEKDLLNKDSIYKFYQKLISLRKSNDILINGDCKLLDLTDSDIITFTRNNNGEKILVICSFSDKKIKFDIPKEYKATKLLISNYDSADFEGDVTTYLEPYEGRAYIIG